MVVGLSGSKCTDWLAVRGGRREVSGAVAEEGDERMDGRLQKEMFTELLLKVSSSDI